MSEGVQSSQQVRKPGGKPYSPKVPSASAFSAQDKAGKHIQCVYYKEFNFSASCERVTNPNERKDHQVTTVSQLQRTKLVKPEL